MDGGSSASAAGSFILSKTIVGRSVCGTAEIDVHNMCYGTQWPRHDFRPTRPLPSRREESFLRALPTTWPRRHVVLCFCDHSTCQPPWESGEAPSFRGPHPDGPHTRI